MTDRGAPPAPEATAVEHFDVEAVNKRESRSLYVATKKIHPKRVKGTFRTLKWWIMGLTLGVYYISPWLRWERAGSAPDQAILIDFVNQRFYFFFIELWPQEVYYIAGLLIMSGIGLFLITSMIGRAWCGYFCPQTVWTDLFLVVERAIEGDRSARIRLDNAPNSVQKAFKRIIKHTIWLIIALLTGGAWVFYFADAPTLFIELFTLQASSVAYGTVAVLTFLTYALGGLMREQVCIYMCPWPRIQAVMMDEESATVTYREARGEPRAPYKKGDSWDNRGHCVDCKACIAACPTGIDIRDGQQLECITCALCIDACDTVMKKIGQLPGLIDYDSLANIDRKAKGQPSEMKIIRPRTVFYFTAWVLAGLIMLVTILWRPDLDINVLRDRNPLFTLQSNGSISNGFTVKILNKVHSIRTFAISVSGIDGMTINVIGASGTGPSYKPLVSVNADQLGTFRMVLNAPKGALSADTTDIQFLIKDISSESSTDYDSVFRGPKK